MSESLEGLQTVIFMDQHDRWRRGDRPLVENYLSQIPDLGTDAERLLDVIYHEILLREEAGEFPDLSDYQRRFPELAEALKLQFEVHAGMPGTRVLELDAPDSDVPPEIEGYRIVGELGRGTYGIVYEAWELTLRRRVALKVIFASRNSDEWSFREAQAIAQLTHPNIVPIHAVGETPDGIFFSQDLIADGTLMQFCRGKPPSIRDTAALVAILADAVQYAHLRRLIHCDLKPTNILLRAKTSHSESQSARRLSDFDPLISDYGLAVHLDAENRAFHGHLRGTLQYMAPEQTGQAEFAIGPATDVYALGVILYELLTGKLPFLSESKLTTFLQIRHNAPPAPKTLRPELPGDLNAICVACLEKDPAKRYPSAASLASDLRRFLNGYAPTVVSTGTWGHFTRWSRRRPAVAALSAAMFCLTAASFVVITQKMQEAQQAEQQERLRADELDAALYRNQFLLAVKAWEGADVGRAEKILRSTNLQRRSLEWHYLNSLIQRGKRTVPYHASSPIEAIHPLREGKMAVQSFDDGIVVIDRKLGEKQFSFHCEGKIETKLHVNRSGSAVAVGVSHADQGWFQIWDSATGKPTQRIGPLAGAPICCEFSESDNQIVTVSWIDAFTNVSFSKQQTGQEPSPQSRNRRLIMERWSLVTGDRISSSDSPNTGQLHQPTAALSPDLKNLAWTPHRIAQTTAEHGFFTKKVMKADDQHPVLIIDGNTGKERHVCLGHSGPVLGLLFSPDSQTLASYGEDGACLLWDVASGKLLRSLRSPGNAIQAIGFCPDSDRIATGGHDREIQLWQTTTGDRLGVLRGHEIGIRSLAFSEKAGPLLSGDQTGHILEWKMESSQSAARIMASSVIRMAFDEKRNQLMTTDLNGSLVRYDLKTSDWVAHREVLHHPVHDFCIHPDQEQIASGDVEGRLSLGMLNDPTAWRTLEQIPRLSIGNPHSLVFSPDGKRLACLDEATRHVLLVDTNTQRFTVLESPMAYRANSISFHSDGRQLAAACDDRDILIWDIPQQKLIRRIPTPARVHSLAFRPQGSDLAGLTTDDRHSCVVWDSDTGEQKLILNGHKQNIYFLECTPDGKRLITGGEDRQVKIWDADSGEELLSIDVFERAIWRLAIGGDSSRLAVSSGMPPENSRINFFGDTMDRQQ